MNMLKAKIKERFRGKDYDKIVEIKPLLFGSFVPTLYAEGDTEKKKALNNIYCELTDRTKVSKKVEDQLM